MQYVTSYTNTIRAFFEGMSWRSPKSLIVLGAGIILIAILAYALSRGGAEAVQLEERSRVVETVEVSAFAQHGSAVTATAAARETVLRAETAGTVKRVSPEGSRVAAGTVVAELDNASQRAALTQTEGALDSAKAAQQKVLVGTRSEQRAILEASYESAKSSAVSALLAAYGSADSAINDTSDEYFNWTNGISPQLKFSIPDVSRDVWLESTRLGLTKALERQERMSTTVSVSSDLLAEISTTEDEIRDMRTFLDTLLMAINSLSANDSLSSTQIASYKTSATAARTSLTNSLSALAGARNALVSAQKSLELAQNGADDSDMASAAAGVKQSQGAYASALAAYEKTLVRARVSGTIVACSAKVGDIVNMGADICRISSTGADANTSYALPLSAVKYTPSGAYVFVVGSDNKISAIEVQTGLVTASSVTVTGLIGDEKVVKDVRGLKSGDEITVAAQ